MSLRRRKEADMMEKARLEKQKQFYTNVAHEFRSPAHDDRRPPSRCSKTAAPWALRTAGWSE